MILLRQRSYAPIGGGRRSVAEATLMPEVAGRGTGERQSWHATIEPQS
jgi:hypothetical protein